MKIRIMKRKGTLLSSAAVLSTAMLLTACGGDGGDSPVDDGGANPGESGAQALLYAYPDNGQGEISTAAPVVLRFSSSVNLGEAQNSITLYEGDAQTGTVVNTTPESVTKEPNNVLLQPDEDLKPNQTYTVVIEDLRLRKGTAKDQTLTFTTRPLHEGPKSLVVKDDAFEVSRRMPDGSAMEPVMDFSSFRFQFTQPVDRATATYGDSVTLTSSGGDTVDATLLINGAYMTVDPEPEYLNAGETYTLDITADLASTYGENFGAQSYTLTPKDSSPGREPAILVQKLTQGDTSRLTGKPINQVPVNGTLLGENKNITQASAEVVRAELADVTTYTDVTPIRLPKGTVLNGAEINPILIGGEVDAGFGSGDVTMTVLSDASGYLVPNPYAENNPDALRIVHLLMDVGIATSEARANGAFTQDLLHIELVGLAEVDPEAGVLNLDAVSVVEPDILGQEYGYGMLSFQLQSYKDQSNPPQVADDTTPPTLQSWMPRNRDLQNKAVYHRPGDPLIFTFDEPLAKKSLDSVITLTKENGDPVEFTGYIDGSSVVVHPADPILYSLETDPVTYEVEIKDGITDVAGNNFAGFQYSFEMPTIVEQVIGGVDINGQPEQMIERAPIVSAIYPGYPCVIDEMDRDLSANIAGRCVGGISDPITEGMPENQVPASDLLPVMGLPTNRPIIVNFSETMNLDSIQLGSTFLVQEIDEQGGVIGGVDGRLVKEPARVTFYPDTPWGEGTLYKSVLRSNGDMTSEICDPAQNICGADGFPLQTQILGEITRKTYAPDEDAPVTISTAIPAPAGGGRDMENFFRGAEATSAVLQNLSNLPNSDVNSNYFHDANRTVEEPPNLLAPHLQPREYAVEEYGATGEPDPNADQTLSPINGVPIDLDGVLGGKNSVKVLSRDTAGLDFDAEGIDNIAINSVNVGCGFQDHIPLEESPGAFYAIPVNCPKQKFSYISGNLNADVTDVYDEQREALKVHIWPGQLTATSLVAYTRLSDNVGNVPSQSGPQIMRMRYMEDDTGVRNQPITGWIFEGADGPVLEAEVDLYVDLPELQHNLFAMSGEHNIHTYPISLRLRGGVEFLEDGRMTIEQVNMELVDIDVRLFSNGTFQGYMDLRIPEGGTKLNYTSQPIKN